MIRTRLLLVSSLFAATAAFGQWSEPARVLHDSLQVVGGSFVCGPGDTVWAVLTVSGGSGPAQWHQVCASWSQGDSWAEPHFLTPRDSSYTFSAPSLGLDAAGRLWASWYRGEYPVFDPDSLAIWTALRDSSGWHQPERAIRGVTGAGPASFASDRQGRWLMGFAALTPYTDFTYSSAMFSRFLGDTWKTPGYVAEGTGTPIEVDYLAPTLVSRPDSGVWSVQDMRVMTSGYVLVRTIVNDAVARTWLMDGIYQSATADSLGRLWVLFSRMQGYLLTSTVFVDSTPVDTQMVSETGGGQPHVCTDASGWVWVLWTDRGTGKPVASYNRGPVWSVPEAVTDSTGEAEAIGSDSRGRIYALFRARSGRILTVYRSSRPSVAEPASATCGRRAPSASVVRAVLEVAGCGRRELVGITGRKVMELVPGPNDVSRLAPGVYFVKGQGVGSGSSPGTW
jgi:hypothetical protein